MIRLVVLVLAFCCCKPQTKRSTDDAPTEIVVAQAVVQPDAGISPRTSSVGFRLPSSSSIRRAIGPMTGLNPAQLIAFTSFEDFSAMPFPGDSDWLEAHFEAGQSYNDYVRGASVNRLSDYRNTIYLQPIGKIGSSNGPSLRELQDFVQAFFQVPVKPLRALAVSDVNRGLRERSTCEQILVQSIFAAMRPRVPDRAYAVLALTLKDLYPGDDWNYVFGQATLRERIGVQSLARYFPSFYGDSDKDRDKLIRRRAYKVLAHETGHMFGLEHCTYFHCVMNGVNNMEEADRSPLHLCPVCLRKLQLNARFDLGKRHRSLARQLRKHGLLEEAAWHADRAKKIGSVGNE